MNCSKSKDKCISFVLTLCSLFGICVSNNCYTVDGKLYEELGGGWNGWLWKIQKSLQQLGYEELCIGILLYFAFLYLLPKVKKNLSLWNILFGAVSALILLLCESYYHDNNWDRVFGNGTAVLLSIVRGIGIAIPASILFSLVSEIQVFTKDKSEKSTWKQFFVIFASVMVAWTPYLIIMFPGNVSADATDAIAQVLGYEEYCWTVKSVFQTRPDMLLNNHHPVLYTMILAFFVKVGEWLGSYAWGLELYCIIQSICFAASGAYLICYLRELGVKKGVYIGSWLFFALNPLFPLWGATVVKDVPFSFVMLLFVIFLKKAVDTSEFKFRKHGLPLMISALFLMLIRNNGTYILLVLLPFVLLGYRKDKKKAIHLFAVLGTSLLIVLVGIQGILFSCLEIPKGSRREVLSVPVQQIARTITEYDDFTEEEESSILAVLGLRADSIEKLSEKYNPMLADPVKNSYDKNCTSAEFKEFLRVWLRGLLRHPDSYVEAFLNLNYSWFSMDSVRDFHYYNGIMEDELSIMLPGAELPKSLASARKAVWRVVAILEKIPLTQCFIEFSVYTWFYVICLLMMLKKKRYSELLCTGALYVNYLICFVGPVAYTRYALPMIACAPFVLAMTFKREEENEIAVSENTME